MNNNKRDIVINLISNTIFQIIIMVVSGTGIFYTFVKMIKSLRDNKISISLLTLIILVVSCILITITIFALIIKLKKFIRKEDEKREFHDVDDYYFVDYKKHLTIYKNGNGIVIHNFTVIVNNKDKFKRIRRKLNIEDGNINSCFPSMNEMMATKKSERFDKFGFWYYAKDNIISEVKEFYWQKNSSEESKKAKSNPKEIRWIFKIDKQRIKEAVPYHITYAISVPGLAPLENGKLNCNLLSDEFSDISSSNMNIDHKIRNLKYIVSFEKEVELENSPRCAYIIGGQDESNENLIDYVKEDDILYDKYVFCINAPKFNSDIKITWKYNKINTI